MTTSIEAKKGTAAALLAEHKALRETLDGLDRELNATALSEAADWCEAVSLGLRMLRAHLLSHFAQEEKGGLLEEIQRAAPEQQEACERLLREHGRLLDELDWLAMQAMLRLEPADLSGGLRRLLERLARHEQREDDLLRRALDATRGAPD